MIRKKIWYRKKPQMSLIKQEFYLFAVACQGGLKIYAISFFQF